jgi:hypothetical protein
MRQWGLILLLVGSLALGVGMGEMFHRVFVANIPPAMLSQFNKATAQVTHILYGVLAGVVMFLWAILAASLAPLFSHRAKPKS